MKFRISLLAAALASAQLASAAILAIDVGANSNIREDNPNSNYGTSQILFVGDTGANGFRSALEFDLSNPLLTGATINSVTLTFFVRGDDTGSANANVTINLHELSSSFTNGDGTTNSGVSWNTSNGSTSWTSPGGDFGSSLASATGNPFTLDNGDSVTFASTSGLTSAVDSAVGSSFYLMAVSATEGADANRNLFQFASTRNTTGSVRGPVLTIDYTPVPEPSTALLGGLGMLALFRRRRRA